MDGMSEVVAQSLEGVDRGDEQVQEPVVEETTPEPTPEQAEEAEISQIAADLVSKNPNLKGSIDVSRHQAVLTRNRNAWDKERKELSDKYEKLKWAEEKEAQAAFQALALAETDQRKFAELLLKDPRFAEILSLKDIQKEVEKKIERPGPNATSQDGTFQYYDDKGLEDLLNWHGGEVEKRMTDAFEKRFGKIEQEYNQRMVWNKSVNEQRQRLNLAREKWPGFKDAEEKIKAYLGQPGNENLLLEDAYRDVVIKHFQDQTQVNEQELRKKIMEELRLKPKAATDTKAKERERIVDEDGVDSRDAKSIAADIIKRNLPRD